MSVPSISPRELGERQGSSSNLILMDVRDDYETQFGMIPGALHFPLDELEERTLESLPDRNQTLVVYCTSEARSAQALRTLRRLGYERLFQLAGGFESWQSAGYASVLPDGTLREVESDRGRYSRQISLNEVGLAGQSRICQARVLVIGLGGLGSPAALYLAGAGVGVLGLVDSDAVEWSNLHRQILHDARRVGTLKTESAKSRIYEINSEVQLEVFTERFDANRAERILSRGWDVIIDGTDNFETRETLNTLARSYRIPVCHGSIDRFEGRVTTFLGKDGPCYRCLFPKAPTPSMVGSCSERGVLGVLPGLIGTLQATEALKIILGIGQLLVGRLLTYDALTLEFRQLNYRKHPGCSICSSASEAL